MASEGLDYDHELNNGWTKYQNLILQEMKRLADALENQDEKLTAAILDAAVSRTQFDALKMTFEEDKKDAKEVHDDFEQRLRTLEQAKNQSSGVGKWKNAVFPTFASVAVTLFTTVLMIMMYVWLAHPWRKG